MSVVFFQNEEIFVQLDELENWTESSKNELGFNSSVMLYAAGASFMTSWSFPVATECMGIKFNCLIDCGNFTK